MENETAILQELKELNSGLADVSRILPYKLPDSYFANMEQKIAALMTKNEDAEVILTGIDKEMPFQVPQGYFDQLTTNVMAKVTGKPADVKANPFVLPANYFTSLPARALQAAQAKEEGEKGIIPVSWIAFKHLRLAAAAVLLLCIGMGAYTTLFNTVYHSAPEALLRSVPKTEIEAYLDASEKGEPEDIAVANLSFDKKDIVLYLNETGWE